MPTITFVSIEWPVEADCIIEVTTREITNWFTSNGKSSDDLTTIGTVLSGQTEPFNCGSVDGQLQTLFNLAGHIGIIQDCIDNPAWGGLIGKLEIISYTGKEMESGKDASFKLFDWSWITDGTTDAELTPEFIDTGITNMGDPDLPVMPNIGNDIRDTLNTNNGITSGDASGDTGSTTGSGDTGSTTGSGDTTTTTTNTTSPYNPAPATSKG